MNTVSGNYTSVSGLDDLRFCYVTSRGRVDFRFVLLRVANYTSWSGENTNTHTHLYTRVSRQAVEPLPPFSDKTEAITILVQ